MASVYDALQGAATDAGSDLGAGLAALSLDQTVKFAEYARVVLPLDGYVFWVRTGTEMAVKGALHYATDQRQEEDGTQAYNRVVFTSRTEIDNFNEAGPSSILIAEFDGIKASFNARAPFFEAAGLYHYSGTAVLPTMMSQVLDNDPDPDQAIVSNSLPIWLGLNTYVPPYPGLKIPTGLVLYPSFAVPENLTPPYGVVHIAPEGTETLGGAPYLDQTLSSYQLVRDRVRVTLYGCNNAVAIGFFNFVMQYSADTDAIGLMNLPTVRDEKKPQSEISALAQKKTIEFQVSYQQTTARSVARQLIVQAKAAYSIRPFNFGYV